MAKLYILCGLPFSGKSLFAKEMAIVTKAQIVSFDDVWQTLRSSSPEATYDICCQECDKQIKEFLQKNISVIYDSINLSEKHRQSHILLAKEVGAEAVIVYLQVSIEEIKNRRAQSLVDKTHHVVGDDTFNDSLNRIEPPLNAVVLSNEESKVAFLNSLR